MLHTADPADPVDRLVLSDWLEERLESPFLVSLLRSGLPMAREADGRLRLTMPLPAGEVFAADFGDGTLSLAFCCPTRREGEGEDLRYWTSTGVSLHLPRYVPRGNFLVLVRL